MFNYKYTVSQFKPFSVGFDDFFNFTDHFSEVFDNAGFPVYNIFKVDDNHYAIEIALAGYAKEDIDIEHKDGVLTVSHKKPKTENKPTKAIHQGITKKSFTKHFAIADSIKVLQATFINGLLRIDLEEPLPEDKKSNKIQIS